MRFDRPLTDLGHNRGHNLMMNGVAIAVVLAALGWIWMYARDVRDRRRVEQWMRANTVDEPGRSHVDTLTIAKGVALPEPRVLQACMTGRRIFRSTGQSGHWSVWREEPQSVYETRGVKTLGD